MAPSIVWLTKSYIASHTSSCKTLGLQNPWQLHQHRSLETRCQHISCKYCVKYLQPVAICQWHIDTGYTIKDWS